MKQFYLIKSLVLNQFILLFVLMVMNMHTSFAQEPSKLPKCDSLHFAGDSSTVIFYRKKKNGVFERSTNTVLIKPTKNPILHLSSVSLFLQLTKNGVKVDHFSNGVNHFSYSTNNFQTFEAVFPAQVHEKYRNCVLLNNVIFNYETGAVLSVDSLFMEDFHPETFYKLDSLDEQRVLINYYRTPIEPLVLFDEIFWIDSGFGQSGVLNAQLKKWEVPPVYKTCTLKDTLLFCAKETPNFAYADAHFEEPFIWYSNAYDVYVLRNGRYVLKSKNFSHLSAENLADLMGWDRVVLLKDSVHVLTEKEGKIGLWQIELNHQRDFESTPPSFIFQEILPLAFDYIVVHAEEHLIFAYANRREKNVTVFAEKLNDDGSLSIVNAISANEQAYYGRYSDEQVVLIDQQHLSYNDFISEEITDFIPKNSVRVDFPEIMFTRACGMRIVNDSLLYLIDFKLDSFDVFAAPIKSLEYPDEDSLIIDPYSGSYYGIYPPSIRGFDYTGIYNLKTRTWFITPTFQFINVNSTGFLAFDLFNESEKINYFQQDYTLFNLEGDLVFEHVPIDEIVRNMSSYLALISPKDVQTIRDFPEKSTHNAAVQKEFRKDYYIQDENGDWQVYQFFPNRSSFQSAPISKPKALIHYNRSYKYFVYLENDSLYLDWNDELYAVKAEGGNIEIAFFEEAVVSIAKITLTNGDESNVFYSDTALSGIDLHPFAQFQLIGNHLIINEVCAYNNFDSYYTDMEIYWNKRPDISYLFFDAETSVIWEKSNGAWQIASPYYAAIEKCGLGYLARTGRYERFNPETGQTEKLASARTILLDSLLRPISFLDYFDFEGGTVYDFGVSLCTQNGCFLISNNGTILTNAEWDVFELEDGQIKATKYTADSLSNQIFGEDLVIEKVEYFTLPAE